MKVKAFTEEVSESICEYNVGSMQKGCEESFDLLNDDDGLTLLDTIRSLEPGHAIIVVQEG